mmetsp:Transcript_12531/g.29363  ORF Transcript_12531/g.29363 Transcript_12531/m.29363 type:complete len:144 (-) Transcript_12531:216-647(-)
MKRLFLRFVTAVDRHPVSMAAVTVGTTTMAGVALMAVTNYSHSNSHGSGTQARRPLTPQEAHFRAMVEHAQQSTWRERWDTVAMAQEQVLRQGTSETNEKAASEFVQTNHARSKELLRRDREYWRQREESEKEKELFETTTIW